MSKYYTVKQVCEMLEVSDRYVRKLIADQKLPAIRLGHHLRVEAGALDKFINDRRVLA